MIGVSIMRVPTVVLPVLLLALGCGKDQGVQLTSEQLDQLAADRMKKIADDKSLSDDAAIRKYVETMPYAPTIKPNNEKTWATVKPVGGGVAGYMLEIHVLDEGYYKRSSKDHDMLASERNSLKSAAQRCERLLRDLQSRQLKGISYQLFTPLTGENDQHTEVFRATVLFTDLPKLEAAIKGPADPDTVFDPRGKKLAELWRVEKNDYPQIVYEKKK
jgi:hypothetical protein